jgi:hypothetical protein
LQGEIDRLQQKSVTIDIIEGFFNWGPFSGRSGGDIVDKSDFFITLNLRFTTGPTPLPIAITEWSLVIESQGRVFTVKAEPIIVPHPHAIERPVPHHMAQGGISRKAVESIDDLDLRAQLKQGVVSGLIQFVVRDLEKRDDDEFQDTGIFNLRLIDSSRKLHERIRPAEPWPKTGKLIPR